ncbi:MAG TPA: PQQ-binding-like beta-propeller repeat protein [Acidobacteriota bacterium]|nr:PQQ-binding-like beta-propeller repeat protein [Acidobacteriota bacterium]
MTTPPWYRRISILWAAMLLLPPFGLLLLWLRGSTSILRKIGGTLLVAVLTGIYLHLFFGLRIELDGTGMVPIFHFHDPDAHYEALIQSRIEQAVDIPAIEAAPRPAAEKAEDRASPESAAPDAALAAVSEPEPDAPREQEAEWPDFRGPLRDGVIREPGIRTDWPAEGLPRLWEQPIGGGYASFAIAGGTAFTIEQRRHQEVVTAYDVDTGRELWTYAWDAEFREAMGGDGPRATPTWHEGRLYALGATGLLACLEAATGKPIWSLNILQDNDAQNLPWGMAASPLIVDDNVIVLPGGPDGRSVVAYDRITGNRVWSALDDRQAYVSPMQVTLAGRRQILVVSSARAMGLDPTDGRLLWDFPWPTQHGINISQPIVLDENRFFISAGYGHGAAAVEVTGSESEGFQARELWSNLSMKNKFNSPVLHEGFVYGLDEGILACVDPGTGERKWKGGRYGYGQVLLAGDRLIVLTESGDLVLVEATPEAHREAVRFSAISGKTWNYPAVAAGRLLVRNAFQMACFDLRR